MMPSQVGGAQFAQRVPPPDAGEPEIPRVAVGATQKWTKDVCLRYWPKAKTLTACVPAIGGRQSLQYVGVSASEAKAVMDSDNPRETIVNVLEPKRKPTLSLCAECTGGLTVAKRAEQGVRFVNPRTIKPAPTSLPAPTNKV